jgi:hypothetical protein
MSYSLQNTLNFCAAFLQGNPISNWTGNEPATSIATMIRNSLLSAPLCWSWNRVEDSSLLTVQGVQDYTVNLTNFGFLAVSPRAAARTLKYLAA